MQQDGTRPPGTAAPALGGDLLGPNEEETAVFGFLPASMQQN